MWSQVSMIILRANQNSKINLIIQIFFRTLRIFHSPNNNNPVLLIHDHKDYTKRFHLGFKKGVWKVVCSLWNMELNNSIMKGAYHITILVSWHVRSKHTTEIMLMKWQYSKKTENQRIWWQMKAERHQGSKRNHCHLSLRTSINTEMIQRGFVFPINGSSIHEMGFCLSELGSAIIESLTLMQLNLETETWWMEFSVLKVNTFLLKVSYRMGICSENNRKLDEFVEFGFIFADSKTFARLRMSS